MRPPSAIAATRGGAVAIVTATRHPPPRKRTQMSAADLRDTLSGQGQRLLAPVRRQVAPHLDTLAVSRFRTLARRGASARDPWSVEDATITAFSRLVDRATAAGRASSRLEHAVVRAFRSLADADLGAVPS